GVEGAVIILMHRSYARMHSPNENRRMVAISQDHVVRHVNRILLPCLILPNVLPVRKLVHDQQSDAIAFVEKLRVRRIVRGAHHVQSQTIFENLRVPPLQTIWYSAANKGLRLMAVHPANLEQVAVNEQPVIVPIGWAQPNPSRIAVRGAPAISNFRDSDVTVWMVRVPKLGIRDGGHVSVNFLGLSRI